MSEVVHASQGYVEKIARTIAAEEVAKVVAGADTNYDTLKEIADYIKGDAAGAAQLKNKVDTLDATKADATALESEVTRAKGAEAKLVDLVTYALQQSSESRAAVTAEEYRATQAEAALGKRVKELEENPSVEVVTPSADGAGKAADAKAVYEALEGVSNTLGDVNNALNEVSSKADAAGKAANAAGETAQEAKDVSVDAAGVVLNLKSEMEVRLPNLLPRYSLEVQPDVSKNEDDNSTNIFLYSYASNIYTPSNGEVVYIKVLYSDTTPEATAHKNDMELVIDCRGLTEAPKLKWDSLNPPLANFHPRTDAETDFACVAGVRNVYWLTEYVSGEFVVAGWQETEGGNAV
ncbi:MAG: hypothetical protein J6R80_00440 [Kiritimatiellae bacterium]|nr:hypothetical protein [Kiritimatiellia bacterium]